MGILDKLMFWKKGEELGDEFKDLGLGDLDKDMGAAPATAEQPMEPGLTPTALEQPAPTQQNEFGMEPAQQPRQFGMPQQQQQMPGMQQQYPSYPQQAPLQSYPSQYSSKDVEIISSKIDALRSSLELINHRLENLERVIRDDIERRKRSW